MKFEFLGGMLLNGDYVGFVFFLGGLPEKGAQLFLGRCDYGMVVTLLSFLCNFDNLTLKLHQEKRSYPDERWFFIGRFKVASVSGKSVALLASKKVSKSTMSMMQGH